MASSSGSATGNPRNKVALQPGHSLMDWIRLGNSQEDLSGTKGQFLNVTPAQLAKHNTVDDTWICIRGIVYNVTRYLNFHPGGVDELMKGAGKDATKLFDQVHPWVNYESMLKKCVVGRLNSFVEDTIPTTSNISEKVVPSPPKEALKESILVNVDFYQQLSFVIFVLYVKEMPLKVVVHLEEEKNVWVLVDNTWTGWSLCKGKVKWPPRIVENRNELEVKLDKQTRGIWDRISLLPPTVEQPSLGPLDVPIFVSVASVKQISHNVYLISLNHSENTYTYVPVGHHIFVQATIGGSELERPYTPMSPLGRDETRGMWLMVKSYPQGVVSCWLCSLKPGDRLQISPPFGNFSTNTLVGVRNLYLIAAGSGITPMIRLIIWARNRPRTKVELIFFNRTEKDIIWNKEFEKYAVKNQGFKVTHVLSNCTSLCTWTGRKGHVSLELLEQLMPEVGNEETLNGIYACVCGPNAFTQLTEGFLREMGFSPDRYHCFQG